MTVEYRHSPKKPICSADLGRGDIAFSKNYNRNNVILTIAFCQFNAVAVNLLLPKSFSKKFEGLEHSVFAQVMYIYYMGFVYLDQEYGEKFSNNFAHAEFAQKQSKILSSCMNI
ncbi:MAG: hypothetical protein A3A26_01660 [Candidatus Zambryskibacteria bacterium RIFCSPLOWO2_01_FULL_47_14]|uniref:Uncharacterized protein n=1 Tax=Candidatus Zambryskibacteria bacterium RIFCSPLOWO2_01_FULL_47_14 TaxID=1802763 RepID=A0A1G2U9W3_9BACT|nr:MAG: hypothetical protein A3A26_01660 [Candidatus Zambryskibacteria bacterium RIFCSPLOWO2_01_FULL_47_14]